MNTPERALQGGASLTGDASASAHAAGSPASTSTWRGLPFLACGVDDQGAAVETDAAHLGKRRAAANLVLGHDDREAPELSGSFFDGQRDVLDGEIAREQMVKRLDRDGGRKVADKNLEHAGDRS